MKLNYYPETDSLYIELLNKESKETREIVAGLNIDLDEDGHVVGIDIDGASKIMELDQLETTALPVKQTKIK